MFISAPFFLISQIIINFLVFYFLSREHSFIAMVVFGQAHFFQAYLYGAIHKKTFIRQMNLSLFLSAGLYALFHFGYIDLMALRNFAACFFILHFFNDEAKFDSSRLSQIDLVTVALFLLAYVLSAYESSYFRIGYLTLPLILLSFKKSELRPNFMFSLVLFFIYLLLYEFFAVKILLQVFTLTHYFKWYFYYYQTRASKNPKEGRTYVAVSAGMLLFFMALFYDWSSQSVRPFSFYFLFGETFFYVHTVAHLIYSFKLSEYLPRERFASLARL